DSAPKVTPLARKVAEQTGVDLSDVSGSGTRGKITKADVQAVARQTSESVPTYDHTTPLTSMRRTIARRMRESLDTAAQAVHRMEVDMSEAVRLRNKLKEVDINVSYNDIILKATAISLTEHPRMNAAFTEDGIVEYAAVNIGIAVALTDGLVVPVLRNVDSKPLRRIHDEAKVLAKRARDGELSPEEMSGGTFSVSNLGMYEIDSFTAIIDTPESGILAVGAIKDKVVARNNEMVIRPISHLSLTYDHRLIDGAPAARFLLTLKRTLENPYTML
ncbi:MAG: dihydrolipoamide acetyltransferase family protein, partial [Spirochaeta sp.]|nr:dihydrolipoamide acetyltransferase family protein [Spirochaeta sp.]